MYFSEYEKESSVVPPDVSGVYTGIYTADWVNSTIPDTNTTPPDTINWNVPLSISVDSITKSELHIDYKFNEKHYIEEALNHINKTYTQHYSVGKYQATDMIIDSGHGTGFCIGNIIKYAKRYGNKEGFNEKDLYKIIHYAVMQLHVHHLENLSEKKGN